VSERQRYMIPYSHKECDDEIQRVNITWKNEILRSQQRAVGCIITMIKQVWFGLVSFILRLCQHDKVIDGWSRI